MSAEFGFLLIALVLGLPMMLAAVIRIRKVRFLQSKGVPGTGSVAKTTGTPYGSISVVRYTGPDGVERKFNTRGEMFGDQDIVYDPDNPKRAEVVTNLYVEWREWFVLAFFAIVFLGSAIAALVVALS